MRDVRFTNVTALDSDRLHALFVRHTQPYCHEKLTVRVRYSRSSEFSGSCYYRDSRIFINLGRKNKYPYRLYVHLAKAQSNSRMWWRRACFLTVENAYELALFIYLHELFHFLVKQAGRSTRRKEAMCDRFAARVLVDHVGRRITDKFNHDVPRGVWDFQDLDALVAAAPRVGQLLLFPELHAARAARRRPDLSGIGATSVRSAEL
ncbi:MAG: hypothetical protein JNG88_04800 [Phycisphaerales bacterium]|nr:hypothetical protein [Phycisphaerales bacterium]